LNISPLPLELLIYAGNARSPLFAAVTSQTFLVIRVAGEQSLIAAYAASADWTVCTFCE